MREVEESRLVAGIVIFVKTLERTEFSYVYVCNRVCD